MVVITKQILKRRAQENKLQRTSSSLVNRQIELSRIKVGFQYFNLAQFLEEKINSYPLIESSNIEARG